MKDIQTEIQVRQLTLECLIGVPLKERRGRQTIVVDIVCELADPTVSADDMSASVDYGPIIKQAQQIALEREFVLLETLAAAIAATALNAEARIQQITVSCHKPNKFPNCQAVGVRRTFAR